MKLAPIRILIFWGSDGYRAGTVGPGLHFLLRGTPSIVQMKTLRSRKEEAVPKFMQQNEGCSWRGERELPGLWLT